MKYKLDNGKYFLIDKIDFERVSKLKWYIVKYKDRKTNYVMSNKKISVHRFILSAPSNFQVDHINKNGLDNRRCNIRICTTSENAFNKNKYKNNTSGFKGVFRRVEKGKVGSWYAQIFAKGKKYRSYGHKNKESAALAYNKLAKNYHGSFAVLNKI